MTEETSKPAGVRKKFATPPVKIACSSWYAPPPKSRKRFEVYVGECIKPDFPLTAR